MHKNGFEWSFFGFLRMFIPLIVYLMCFLTVFKICSKCCKRRRNEETIIRSFSTTSLPLPQRHTSAENVSRANLPRLPQRRISVETMQQVVVPIGVPSEDVSNGYQQELNPTSFNSQNPPSYEEAISDTSVQVPPYPGFSR